VPPDPELSARDWQSPAEAAALSAGMAVFALFSHRGSPWVLPGAAGLLVASLAIGSSLRRTPRPAELLGLSGCWREVVPYAVLGVAIGAGAGLLHRLGMGLSAWPPGGGWAFVLVACLIGAAEELVYRGWLQGALRPLGWPAAVALAAVAHAGYKTALFAGPGVPVASDLASLAGWTVAGGLVLGVLRQFSGSVVPCLLAHAAFDFVVYRALTHAPWWVWS
jgi:membrane protease YdiL (CAAX protease family)